MAKRALCVGINAYPLEKMRLNGCLNDARGWAEVLTRHYDFATGDVEMLLDAEATEAAMIDGLKRLLAGAGAGDVLVFTNSGHGTYVVDTGGDEESFDQALCPWDAQQHLLVDDELRELFANVPDGVRLTVISDSCHAGTATRGGRRRRLKRFTQPRVLGLRDLADPKGTAIPAFRARRLERHPQSEMSEVLLAGCDASQSAFDDRFEEGDYGAMTYFALRALEAADYRMTYKQLHAKVTADLKTARYNQEPQLEGRPDNLTRQVFT